MRNSSKKVDARNVSQDGESNELNIIAEYNDNRVYNSTPAGTAQEASTIHQILEGIIELDIKLEATSPDVQPFDIMRKIEYNNILVYKRSYCIYRQHNFVIDTRLDFLENNGYPLATQKLYRIVKNKFARYGHYDNPDEIITFMINDLKGDLYNSNSSHKSISNDDIDYIPSIIFFVFSNCQIFIKPPT